MFECCTAKTAFLKRLNPKPSVKLDQRIGGTRSRDTEYRNLEQKDVVRKDLHRYVDPPNSLRKATKKTKPLIVTKKVILAIIEITLIVILVVAGGIFIAILI